MTPYYDADGITLYLGDCREVTPWLSADVLVTDPPYGIGWKRNVKPGRGDAGHDGIAGDADTTCRDEALALWGADRPALVFGSFWAVAPANVRHTLVYRKPPDSGVIGSTTGWRRDVEPVYVVGAWPQRPAHRSSLFITTVAGAGNLAGRYGHPHTKPGDVLAELIRDCPPGPIPHQRFLRMERDLVTRPNEVHVERPTRMKDGQTYCACGSPWPCSAPPSPAVALDASAFPPVADVVTPHYSDDLVTLHHGDCLDVLRTLPDASVDAVVTDPPYGLEFMGREWDAPWKEQARAASATVVEADAIGGFQDGNGGNAFSRSRIRTNTQRHGGDVLTANAGFQEWCERWARECLRVLKPGGHILTFGGTRTWHRLACAVEDAGFEMRDSIAWLYGSGFPKSLDVSKAIDKAAGAERADLGPGQWAHVKAGGTWKGAVYGTEPAHGEGPRTTAPATPAAQTWQGWGTALKPAYEPIVVGRKPLAGTVATNVLLHGTGALNIDGCRVAHASEADLSTSLAKNPGRDDTVTSEVYGAGRGQQSVNPAGRWPTNVLLGHSSECVQVGTRTETVGGGEKASGGFVEGYERGDGFVGRSVESPVYRCVADCQVAELDRQSGVSMSTGGAGARSGQLGYHGGGNGNVGASAGGFGDAGGASRFFPTFRYEAKAPGHERPSVEGGSADARAIGRKRCATCGKQAVNVRASSQCQCPEPMWEHAASSSAVSHPTVKPLDLMRWLVRLVTPPGGTVLEPFAGSGTTAEACVIEGFRCIAVEREATYLPLIVARLSKPIQPDLFGGAA